MIKLAIALVALALVALLALTSEKWLGSPPRETDGCRLDTPCQVSPVRPR
jgi:hypothetical protein